MGGDLCDFLDSARDPMKNQIIWLPSTGQMFDRYSTIDQEDTRKAVDQLEVFLANVDQSVDQNAKAEK